MKNINCKIILFNENHIGNFLVRNLGDTTDLPTIKVEENENLIDALKRLEDNIGFVGSNELLTYVIETSTNIDYVFIGNSATEPTNNDYEWVLGQNVDNINSLNMCEEFKRSLENRFTNGFLLDGTSLIKD